MMSVAATLTVALLAGGDTLRGTVADSAGRPLAGTAISLAELNVTVTAGADGSFWFAGLPSGRYTLVVRRLGYAPAIEPVAAPGPPLTIVLRPTALRLDAVTVTATHCAIAPLTSPLPTAQLADERLRREHEVSLAHALNRLPGVRTLSTGEQVGKPIIRGLTAPRVLVLDNGERLEDYSWSDEDGPSVDARLAERVEVIRGPASVLYGSDAIGGVINVIPDEVPDGRGRSGFARGAAELYGATNNNEVGTVLRAEGASGRVGWRLTGIGRRADNFHTSPGNASTPTGDLYNTGFHAINGEASVGVRGDRGTVTVRYTRYAGDCGLLDGPPVPDDNVNGPLRRLSDNRVQLTSSTLLGGIRLETKSQWQRHSLEEVSDQSRNGDSTPTFDLLLNTYSTDLLIHHAGRGPLSGTLGGSGLYQDNQTRGVVPLVPAARTTGGAVFALEAATVGRWTVLASARADVRHLRADSDAALKLAAQTRDASALTASAGAVFRAAEGLALAANVGRAFRAPTLFELFTRGPHLGEDRYEIGLPDARPEVGVSADVNIRWQRGRVRAELAAYRNQIDHYLYIAPTGQTDRASSLPIYRYQQAQALLLGMEAAAEVAVAPFLTARARLDAVRGTNRGTDQPLPLMPPPRADVEAELHATGLPLGRPRLPDGRGGDRGAPDPSRTVRHPDAWVPYPQRGGGPRANCRRAPHLSGYPNPECRGCPVHGRSEPLQGVRFWGGTQRHGAALERAVTLDLPLFSPGRIVVRIALVAGCALAAAAHTASAQFHQKEFDAYVTRGLQVLGTPGAAVAVVKDGKVLFARGYGVRTVGDPAPVDAHTLFQIGSNTKAFTTAALAILADDGRLSWDDPVTRFLPGFQLYDPYVTREFTVRDLVTHRSGLGLGAGDLLWFHSSYGREEIAYRIRFAKPVSSFRSQYAYDNVLYIVAGEVVRAVATKTWDDFVKERIFVPLGMTETGTTIAGFTGSANAAAPHAVDNGKLQVVPIDSADNIAPAGGIVSNATDLAKWVLCRLDSGRYAGRRLFSERQAREMWTGQTILPIADPPPPLAALRPTFSEYALGWRLRDYRGRKLVSHTGGLAGMTSQITLVPAERLGIVILTNGESDLMAALTYRLLDGFFGVRPTDWVAAFAAAARLDQARADSILAAGRVARDSLSKPSLPLEKYAGRYHDDLYGDAAVTLENGRLVLRFSHSPAFTGDLDHWQYDTFVAHWRAPHLEDAYVTFALDRDGSIDRFRLAAVSPLADFSFDYQDLEFQPVPAPR